MAIIDTLKNLRRLQEFFRNSDIMTISQREVTTVTETFNGDNSTTDFVVSNTNLKNVRSVTVDSNPQTKYTDYDIDWNNNTISFTSAPATGTDNISIEYDYGSTDHIFMDFPREDISLSSYPRVGFDFISNVTTQESTGSDLHQTRSLLSVTVFGTTKKEIETILFNLRTVVFNNKIDITPEIPLLITQGLGPLIEEEDRGNKIMSRTMDFIAPFQFEQ